MKKYFVWILILLILPLMIGCHARPTVTEESDTEPPPAEKREQTKEENSKKEQKKLLHQAKAFAQQYDYEKAITLLNESDTNKAKDIQEAMETYKNEKKELITWPDNSKIPHLFFHSLVVDESKAFDGDSMSKGYQDYMVTIDEFKKILKHLYERGYVLVDLDDIAKLDKKGNMVFQELRLPEGKKPLVLSQDDVSYYEYMKNDGFAKNLTIDDNGKVTNTYVNEEGQVVQGAYDLVPIVDDFVAKHPDFSYRGAKGIIALTGYNGVLGYQTSESGYGSNGDHPNPNIKEDQQQAKKVADKMKREGWTFASHSWGHLDVNKISLGLLKKDTSKWKEEVEPLVGPTDTIIFAFGSDIGSWHPYSNDKYNFLKDQGFDYYANVDASKDAWAQLGKQYFRQSRINVDGLRMKQAVNGENVVLEQFFDVEDVWDSSRPAAN
ncbi:hypothetical protein [Halobacillus massiliensis]|uniref:hypothetical protein n=1 Tax=Halobacillus massiliensis TaxID=1926286 RepID=UPI0009E61C46|nr:hypothetical protein [Halobacillus massiliensis]